MFCTQCGTRIKEEARFCTACGKPVAHPPVGDANPGSPNPGADPRFDQAPPYAERPAPPPPNWSSAGAAAPQARRLRRVMAHKKIAGVCAGFAEYFDMDVTLMRLIWVGLLLIPPHVGLIAYIIAWAVLPKT
jgi:phage shock protein PspC (stress-responsive transcriptional regulator)